MKPTTTTTTNQLIALPKLTTAHTTPTYEPTSVLDTTLSSSPSSAAAGTDTLHHVDQSILHQSSDPFDDWDPALAFLLLDKDPDDTTPATIDHPFHLSNPPPSPHHFDQSHLDHLLRAAHFIESDDRASAAALLSRLNPSSGGRPLQRSAFYFKEALQSLLFVQVEDDPFLMPPSALDVVRKIAAFKAMSELSPVPQFVSFTANQTILESVSAFDGNGGGAPCRPIHVIDFDVGLGGQWSSFMHEVAARCRTYRVIPPPIQLTAVVSEESLETSLMADNLRDFARGLGLRFDVDFVHVGRMGPAALGAVRLAAGESVAVTFTPAVLRLLGGGGADTIAGLLRFVRRVSPRVVVLVDPDSSCSDSGPHQSFRRSFATGLDHFSVVLELLDSASSAVGFAEDQVGRIERALVRPKVWASVRSWEVRAVPWREMFDRAGFKPVPFTEFTESQAEWLTRRAPIGGFHVARREGSMVLNWQGRELASTLAWRS